MEEVFREDVLRANKASLRVKIGSVILGEPRLICFRFQLVLRDGFILCSFGLISLRRSTSVLQTISKQHQSLMFVSILQDQDKEYVGFATLPNQVHRKSVKKGFDFTLMVAGKLCFVHNLR